MEVALQQTRTTRRYVLQSTTSLGVLHAVSQEFDLCIPVILGQNRFAGLSRYSANAQHQMPESGDFSEWDTFVVAAP